MIPLRAGTKRSHNLTYTADQKENIDMWKNALLTRVFRSDVNSFTTLPGIKFRRFINLGYRRILRLASGHRIHLEAYPTLETEIK